MADLFVSYKSEDRARVKPLVDALEADGLSIWWDAHIEGGAGWRQRIEQELTTAACVLVAWTKRSAGPEGEFVHDEATRAKRRGVYLPVLLEKVELPLGFGEKQALPLTGWKGDRADPRYQAVLAAARAVVAGAPRPAVAAAVSGASLGRRAAIGGGVAVGTLALFGGGWRLWRGGIDRKAEDSIAVLPFANLSGDPAQVYFSDGIAEELRLSLSRVAELKVAARTSSELFRGSADIKTAARELGVANVLVGSVRRSVDMVRVTAQLVDGTSGLEKWSESYDRPAGNELLIQSGIAESVARALSFSLGKAASMLGSTRNPEAFEAFLKAQSIQAVDEASVREALAAYDVALASDPRFVAALANRALSLVDLYDRIDVDKRAEALRSLALAESGARDAIALEPALPIAHTALAVVKVRQLELGSADAAFARALKLPGVVSRDLRYGADFNSQMGRSKRALALVDRAIELDPLNPVPKRTRIILLMDARLGDAALAAIDQWEKAHPGETISPRTRTRALLVAGRAEEALAEAGRIPVPWQRLYGTALAQAALGDSGASGRTLAQLQATDPHLIQYQIGSVYAAQGKADQAFEALGLAVENRDPGLLDLRSDHTLDGLRTDPRFAELEKRLGFPVV